ncbi:MAG: type II toxin-antitoxin system prevent-host-death family antitoxin [Chloroflexi bacterium]|nr:MAG: type II toxin-antitoxin system prevent-host-death family antitoxin [Chloroflexota bacterium]
MRTAVGVYEARTHFAKLIERVERGEHIVITRYGVPVAVLQPVEKAPISPPEQVIASLKAFRQGRRLGGLSVRKMIEEGRQ